MIKCCERKGTTNSAPQWLLLYLIKQIQLQILYFRQSIDHFVARWVLLMFFVIFFLPSWFCHKIQVVIHVTHKILDFARMAVISNRAITLSDSLKNTVDTQDSIKTRHRCIEQCYTIPICIEYNWSGQKKRWTRGKEKGKIVGLNLLQPLHLYCGQCNTLSFRNQGSEPAKLDLVRKSKNCIDLMFFQWFGHQNSPKAHNNRE